MDYNGALRTLPHNPHSEITDFRLWLECTGLNIKFLKIWGGEQCSQIQFSVQAIAPLSTPSPTPIEKILDSLVTKRTNFSV